MAIHHSTIKRAASLGVILTSTDDAVTAHHTKLNIAVTFDHEVDDETDRAKDALVAVLDMRDYMFEHDDVRLSFEDGDFVARFPNSAAGDTADWDEVRDPDLADLFETLAERGQDGSHSDPDEEEAGSSGSVVPDKYKKEYAARGNPSHCGDWLAETLNSLCRVSDGKKDVTDLDRLETIAAANDVSPERYGRLGHETNGWQGRYRMTVRNMLTPRVAAKGFLFVPEGCGRDADVEIKAPRQWCLEHAPKPKKEAGNKKGKGA